MTHSPTIRLRTTLLAAALLTCSCASEPEPKPPIKKAQPTFYPPTTTRAAAPVSIPAPVPILPVPSAITSGGQGGSGGAGVAGGAGANGAGEGSGVSQGGKTGASPGGNAPGQSGAGGGSQGNAQGSAKSKPSGQSGRAAAAGVNSGGKTGTGGAGGGSGNAQGKNPVIGPTGAGGGGPSPLLNPSSSAKPAPNAKPGGGAGQGHSSPFGAPGQSLVVPEERIEVKAKPNPGVGIPQPDKQPLPPDDQTPPPAAPPTRAPNAPVEFKDVEVSGSDIDRLPPERRAAVLRYLKAVQEARQATTAPGSPTQTQENP